MKRFSSAWSSKSRGLLHRHCLQQAFGTDDSHDPLHVVGEHIQTHLRADAGQPTCEEMCGSHPLFERPEGMLNSALSDSHHVRRMVQPVLHFV